MIPEKRSKNLKKRITISFAPKQRSRLERIADEEGRSVAFVVRTAVAEYVDKKAGSVSGRRVAS